MIRIFRWLVSFYGVALLVSLISAICFVALADALLSGQLLDMNQKIMLTVHRQSTPALDQLARLLSWIGSTPGLVVISIGFALVLLAKKAAVDLLAFAFSALGSVALTHAMKAIFQMTRPHLFTPLEFVSSNGFPSGHTLSTFCVLGFIGYWIVVRRVRSLGRWMAAAGLLLVAAAVGLSRVYLGVHWPTDVAGGLLLATIWIATCLSGAESARRRLEAQKV